ncbi:MAG TPA: HAD-IA family hydrolase [Acidimicrobiales bacterium]|nr:HAD-IA family hydrolase [Acidimicrobiales bacterium]
MAIRAVIFDFGGVILTSPFEAFTRYEEAHGLPAGFLRGINTRNPDTNAWAKLERSEVDLTGFAELFEAEAREAGHEVDGMAVIGLLAGTIRTEMLKALRRCHERLKTAMLTNNFVAAGDRPLTRPDGAGTTDPWPMASVLDHFDVIVESSRAGVRKPDPAIYEMVCCELGVEPPEAVFLDDLGVNLKPARAMGMTTIKVDDPAVAIAELEAVVGFPLS